MVLMVITVCGCTPPSEPEVPEDKTIHVESISCSDAEVTLTAGEQKQLNATVKPDDADNKEVTYSSSNTSVAMVNEKGLIVSVAAGTCDIIITSKDNEKATFTVKLTVKEKETEPVVDPTPEPTPDPEPDPKSEPTPDPTPEPTPEPEPDKAKVIGVYTNGLTDVDPKYYPVITLYDNGEFTFNENMYEGMVTYMGTYYDDGQEITLYSDYMKYGSEPSQPADIGELKLVRIGDKYLQLHSRATMSQYDDIFTKDYKEKELAYTYYLPMEGTDRQYWTKVEMYTDKSFIFYENFYSGIEIIEGIYATEDGTTYIFYSMKNTGRTGFTYREFTMEQTQVGFKLTTDLYCTKKDSLFTEWDNHLLNP